MSEQEQVEVEAILDGIQNFGVANGAPFSILRDMQGRFALGQMRGETMTVASNFVDMADAAEWALRALGGDKRAITHPRIIIALALALVGPIAEGELARKRAKEKANG